jgi:peptidoglycan/LPS O-acetylase OafA/YrhL
LKGPRLAPEKAANSHSTLRFPHVRALDGVRGLAAVAVVIHHALFTGTDGIVFGPVAAAAHFIYGYFYLGVDLFFVLSGYLITSLLLQARRRPNFYYNFYWKRAFRILPALFLILAISRLLFHTPYIYFLPAIFFIANFTFMWGIPDVGPCWSLSIEEQFYLIWPTLIHRTKPRHILQILIATMVACSLVRFVGNLLQHGRLGLRIVHVDGLAWGAMLAVFAFLARVPYRQHNAGRLWRRFAPVALGVGAVFFAAAVTIHHEPDFNFFTTSAAPLFTALLLYLITHTRAGLTRLLESRPLRFLGDISYMLYLSHAYALEIYDRLFAWHTVSAMYLRFGVCLAVSILFCTLSLYLFERPIGRLRRFVLKPE